MKLKLEHNNLRIEFNEIEKIATVYKELEQLKSNLTDANRIKKVFFDFSNLLEMDTAFFQIIISAKCFFDNNKIEYEFIKNLNLLKSSMSFMENLTEKELKMGKLVLVVDDSASMRGLIVMMFKQNGYDVIEGGDGLEGLAKLKVSKVDLIVSDLNMPNMNGIEFIKAIKADPNTKFTPIIMLTTEGADDKKAEGQASGAKAWVLKPVKPETMMAVVSKILG